MPLFYVKLAVYFVFLNQGRMENLPFDVLYLFLKTEVLNGRSEIDVMDSTQVEYFHLELVEEDAPKDTLPGVPCIYNGVKDVYMHCCGELFPVDLKEFGLDDVIVRTDTLSRPEEMPGGWFFNSTWIAFFSEIAVGEQYDYVAVELLHNGYLCTGGFYIDDLYERTIMQNEGAKFLFIFDKLGKMIAVRQKEVRYE